MTLVPDGASAGLAGVCHRVMAQEIPEQFLGTSNTAMAMQHGLLPMGTLAHELYMVMAGMMADDDATIRASHNRVLQEWWDEYGWGLSIALTDTYGTDFFFRDMTLSRRTPGKACVRILATPSRLGRRPSPFTNDTALTRATNFSFSAMGWTSNDCQTGRPLCRPDPCQLWLGHQSYQ